MNTADQRSRSRTAPLANANVRIHNRAEEHPPAPRDWHFQQGGAVTYGDDRIEASNVDDPRSRSSDERDDRRDDRGLIARPVKQAILQKVEQSHLRPERQTHELPDSARQRPLGEHRNAATAIVGGATRFHETAHRQSQVKHRLRMKKAQSSETTGLRERTGDNLLSHVWALSSAPVA